MSLGPFAEYAADLAPGDRAVLDASWDGFTLEAVRSASDPLFDLAWQRLWREFGDRGEMERREVIAGRLAWDPRRPVHGHALLYEMLVVRRNGEMVAVRDHTAIVTPAALAFVPGEGPVVHLSHVLVEPSLRGHGLASWLRALPVATARRCLAAARGDGPGAARDEPAVTLVAEMEHDDGVTPAVIARLRSYARAGFRVVDPARFHYVQPDFRSAAEIDRTSVQPVPLCLVVRRVGREHEGRIPAPELRTLVAALQAMFAEHVRDDHMEHVRQGTSGPTAGSVDLLVPGAPVTTKEPR
jgi:GNAT superfamily N-acetyltransferase